MEYVFAIINCFVNKEAGYNENGRHKSCYRVILKDDFL